MNKKKRFLLYLLIFCFAAPVLAQNPRPFTVVLDAGHGGDDPGALGSKLKEKDVNLAVALKVGKLIKDNCPDIKVVYTRNTDVFVELYRRAQIANNNHADLFISFHCNASPNAAAKGIETFVMGLHKSEANQAVARAENAAMLKEQNYQNNYDGFNPNSPEANVIFSLYSSAYLNNSILLADKVQRNLLAVTHLDDRGVKQAGFWVLYKVAMPSILIEQGFVSNPDDEAYLGKGENQDKVAASIYNAFADYHTTLTGTRHNHIITSINKPKEEVETKPVTETKVEPKPVEQKEKVTPPATDPTPAVNESGVCFKVQFFASPEKIELTDKRFAGLKDVGRYFENNFWKYTIGCAPTPQEASKLLAEVKATYKDAFLVIFQGDRKITREDADKLLKK